MPTEKASPERRARGRRAAITNGPKERTRLTQSDAADCVVRELAKGVSVGDALAVAGRSRSWYEGMRRNSDEFRNRVDAVREGRGDERIPSPDESFVGAVVTDPKSIDFATFSEHFLGQKVFPHTQNIVDLLEGRDPHWMHPSFHYELGYSRAGRRRKRYVVNLPPEHAKTTSVTVNYSVYRICMNPSVRITLISKSQDMAKKMLLEIKTKLTHPNYQKLIDTYAPAGGFEEGSAAWTSTMIYVNGRNPAQKDPTAQAIGIRGHVYGSRADLIIMDDCVDNSNTNDYEKQINWIQSEVQSRVSKVGAAVIVGTRLAPRELYSEITNGKRYGTGRSPWTYLAMPAVLEFKEEPKDWVTLWPKSDSISEEEADYGDVQPDEDGYYPKWDGEALVDIRDSTTAAVWARVYQQEQITDDTIFNPDDIRGCILGSRNVGRIQVGMPGNRPEGMNGLQIVAGLDPASSGFTAAVVIGLDTVTFKRYVLDVRNKPGMHPDELRAMIYEITDRYQVCEWVIEKNGFQGFLANDREVNDYLRARGCVVKPHFTGNIKHDPDFGVAAMGGLFKGWKEGNNLIELPSPHRSEGVKALVEQLEVWVPQAPKTQKTDTVMALWFAELACQARVQALSTFMRSHMKSQFHTSWDRRLQKTYKLDELIAGMA